jgi:hypothetical protein
MNNRSLEAELFYGDGFVNCISVCYPLLSYFSLIFQLKKAPFLPLLLP